MMAEWKMGVRSLNCEMIASVKKSLIWEKQPPDHPYDDLALVAKGPSIKDIWKFFAFFDHHSPSLSANPRNLTY